MKLILLFLIASSSVFAQAAQQLTKSKLQKLNPKKLPVIAAGKQTAGKYTFSAVVTSTPKTQGVQK